MRRHRVVVILPSAETSLASRVLRQRRARPASLSGRRAFNDHAARDSIPGVSGGVGLVIVVGSMENNGASVLIEERVRPFTERDLIRYSLKSAGAEFGNEHVGQIPGVVPPEPLNPCFLLVGLK